MADQPTTTPIADSSALPRGRIAGLGWLLPIGFGSLAIAIYATSGHVRVPLEPVQVVQRSELVVSPRRAALTDPAHIMINGAAQSCNGCHQIFRSASPSGTLLNYHQDIRLDHGLNNRCVNCHDAENRERLALRDELTVPFAEAPRLCAQCHGTTFRDWERGTHGKTLGSWVTGSEAQRRLRCNECHDPHSPRYQPMMPLPKPNTLRMGEQPERSRHATSEQASPLQHWFHAKHDDPQDAPAIPKGHP